MVEIKKFKAKNMTKNGVVKQIYRLFVQFATQKRFGTLFKRLKEALIAVPKYGQANYDALRKGYDKILAFSVHGL